MIVAMGLVGELLKSGALGKLFKGFGGLFAC
jgi:hypothetical protein